MKVVVTRYAMRLSNRVPEVIAAACLVLGLVVCGLILAGRSSATAMPAEAATTRTVDSTAAGAKAIPAPRSASASEYAAAQVGTR